MSADFSIKDKVQKAELPHEQKVQIVNLRTQKIQKVALVALACLAVTAVVATAILAAPVTACVVSVVAVVALAILGYNTYQKCYASLPDNYLVVNSMYRGSEKVSGEKRKSQFIAGYPFDSTLVQYKHDGDEYDVDHRMITDLIRSSTKINGEELSNPKKKDNNLSDEEAGTRMLESLLGLILDNIQKNDPKRKEKVQAITSMLTQIFGSDLQSQLKTYLLRGSNRRHFDDPGSILISTIEKSPKELQIDGNNITISGSITFKVSRALKGGLLDDEFGQQWKIEVVHDIIRNTSKYNITNIN